MPVKNHLRVILLLASLLAIAACSNRPASQPIVATVPPTVEPTLVSAEIEPAAILAIPTPLPTIEPVTATTETDSVENGDSEPVASGLKGPIVVGSRDFTEQYILGHITMQLLKNAGFEVIDNTGLGGTNTAHYALVDDEIDVYWEYTGTALAEFHNIPALVLPADPQSAFDTISALDLTHNNLKWLQYSAFNDTYTLMIREGTIADGMESIEDLSAYMNENDAPLIFCVENDFYGRNDGFFPLLDHYGFSVDEDNILLVAYDQLYEELRSGGCDVAEGFSTDGRISAWGFKNLADSREFFPAYNASPIVRQDLLEQYPEIAEILEEVSPILDNDTMTRLNADVDLGPDGVRNSGDEVTLEQVAISFLEEAGLIGDRPQIVVGSRDFTEQFVLAHITMQYLEYAGYDVVDKTGLGGTQAGHAALRDGDIDILWEYTGTALSEFHNIPSSSLPTDPQLAWNTVSALDLLHNDLIWQKPGVFNDTYTLMIRPGTIPVELNSMEDLAAYMNENDSPLTLCVENDFFARGDGLYPLLDHYGFTFREENIQLVAYDQLYDGLREGTCDVAEGFSTDGRISAWGFQNLADSKSFFPAYNAAPVVRKSVLDQHPELAGILDEIGVHLDDAMMTLLNARIDVGADGVRNSGDEETLQEVAASFLEQTGLTTDRPQIAVGSRDFTEQFILGYLTILLLEENGFNVADRTGLGGTNTGYSTLLEGGVDVVWEYTGTALANFHDTELLPTDPDAAWEMARELDEPNNVNWLASSGFNDTYTLMVNPEQLSIAPGLISIEDLASYMNDNGSPLTVCVENDFYGRDDGLFPLMEYYGFNFTEENIQLVGYDQLYENLRSGECDVAEGFSTDGRIAAWGFRNLEDSFQFFPAYNAAPLVRQDAVDANPEIVGILNQLGPLLTNETITSLNAQVDVGLDGERNSGDEESAESAARQFLCERGLISDCPNLVATVTNATPTADESEGEDETVVVSAESTGCEDIIVNGTFEVSDKWRIPTTRASADYSATQSHAGDWSMQLGPQGRGTLQSYSAATQILLVPEEAVSANISFWYYPVSLDLVGGDENGLYIFDSTLAVLQQQFVWGVSNEQAWVQAGYDLSAYAGEEIALHFVVINDGDGVPTNMFIDDVVMQVCYE